MVCAVFGFGVTEMVLVAFVAILLFPPRELPKIAHEIARLYGYARRTADQFRSAILEDEELNKPIREIRSIYHETRYELRRAEELAQREMAKVKMEARMAARSQTKAAAQAATSDTAAGKGSQAASSDGDGAAATSGSGSVPETDPRPEDSAVSALAPEPGGGAPLSTAGERDAPPPGRKQGGTGAGDSASSAPQPRRPVASVPRGTVTPHGAARKPTESGAAAHLESAAEHGGITTSPAPARGSAEGPLASPHARDDSAAGAA